MKSAKSVASKGFEVYFTFFIIRCIYIRRKVFGVKIVGNAYWACVSADFLGGKKFPIFVVLLIFVLIVRWKDFSF